MIFTAQTFSIVITMSTLFAPSEADDSILKTLKSCALLNNDHQRLACYDSLLRTDSSKAVKSPKSKFGLKKLAPSPLKKPIKPVMSQNPAQHAESANETSALNKILKAISKNDKNINSAAYEILSHKKARNNAYIFTMKDGSVWKQTDAMRRPLKKGGFTATISKGNFGSYILKPKEGSWSVRVKRIK